jgi:hypothetical protein
MEFSWDAHTSAPHAFALPAGQTTAVTTSTATTACTTHNTATSLNALQNTICYLHEHKVLVCTKHATALQNLDAHLRQHHAIKSEVRKQLIESYSSLEWIRDAHKITLPAPLGRPITELGAPLDGFQCAEKECNLITLNLDELRKHRKSTHNLV